MMNIRRIFLVSILLLAILTLSAVSASENMTDDLESQIDQTTASIEDEVILSENSDELCSEISSNLTQDEKTATEELKAPNDDEELGLANCDVECYTKQIYYGDSRYIVVYVNAYQGTANVYINGVNCGSYNMEYYDRYIDVYLPEVNTSQLKVKIDYKDGVKYKSKSVTATVDVIPSIKGEYAVGFETSSNFTARYFANGEAIKFELKNGMEVIDEKTVIINNSKAIYSTPDNLGFGNSYTLYCYYGNLSNNIAVCTIPRISLPYRYYYTDEQNVTVEFPQEYVNYEAAILIDGKEFLRDTINNESKINFIMPYLKPMYAHDMNVNIIKNNKTIYKSVAKHISVTKFHPDIDFDLNLSDEYVIGKELLYDFDLEALHYYETDGIIVLLDGVQIKRLTATSNQLYLKTKTLEVGKVHNLTFKFSGCDYLNPFTREYLFKLISHQINIDENPCLNNGERIEALLPADATGTVTLYVDGKLVENLDVSEDFNGYIDNIDDSGNHVVGFLYDNLNMKMGDHTIRLVYKGNKKAFDVTRNITLGYAIPTNLKDTYKYGEKNIIEFKLPEDAKGSFKIILDGEELTKYEKDDNYVRVDISELIGEHNIVLNYSGDGKYSYPLTVNGTFNVIANIDANITIAYKSSDDQIRLILPKNATGNLVVELDDKPYVKKALVDGKAGVSFADLPLGNYRLHAYYDGDDYNLTAVRDEINVKVMVVISKTEINYDESVDVYINAPNTYKDTLIVTYDGKTTSKKLVNGSARITLSNLKVGLCTITAGYSDNDFIFLEKEFEVHVYPTAKLPKNFVVFNKNTIEVGFPSSHTGTVTVRLYYDSESHYSSTYNVKGGKNYLTLPSVPSGKYTMEIDYIPPDDLLCNDRLSYDIYMAPAASAKLFAASASAYCGDAYAVKVLDSNGLPLKNAKVSIKVGNSKAVTKTTNANGIAQIAMNYKPGTYSLVVKYKTQTLKPKVTVKKVLALKAVAIKKSAKKLVLTATLKKGKVAIKSKTVTFKFNGKTYKAKTGKTGIAKVTIPKAVLQKLNVGKKITYQAIYLKDTVKRSAKVQK